jgi:hypothetical protein
MLCAELPANDVPLLFLLQSLPQNPIGRSADTLFCDNNYPVCAANAHPLFSAHPQRMQALRVLPSLPLLGAPSSLFFFHRFSLPYSAVVFCFF